MLLHKELTINDMDIEQTVTKTSDNLKRKKSNISTDNDAFQIASALNSNKEKQAEDPSRARTHSPELNQPDAFDSLHFIKTM